ncbi:MAG: response regulator containing CheY-like receiver domain and AraC-type DNA-binding domain [Clostridia bacterium]|nr:response regulator containing CheY-like receiver domain and AraC-type DNA-binding domain [Clostridia bacterium]
MHNIESDNMINMAGTFEVCTHIKCTYIELEEGSIYQPQHCNNPLCSTLHKVLKQDYSCKSLTVHAYEQAQRFAIAYIYEEIAIKYKINTYEIQNLLRALDDIDTTEPYRVTALANLLEVIAMNGSTDAGKLSTKIRKDIQEQQVKIHEYLMIGKADEPHHSTTYSIEKEKLLTTAIRDCDIDKARELLNSILGDLFVIAGADLDTIRTRLVELIVLLSRGAVEGGVSTKEIFGLNGQYIKKILEVDTIDDLYFWLNQILIRFVDAVFIYRNSRHGDSIKKAIHYINQNYMKKITLEEVANAVHVSPNYFSKIFKEETGINFAIYLNQVRVEGAKKLLIADDASLVDVAYLAGFEDQSYFSRVFKKYTGISPKRYKELQGNQME